MKNLRRGRTGVWGASEYEVSNVPRVRITRNAAFTLATATVLAVTWDSSGPGFGLYDTDSMWSATRPTEIVVKTAGLYSFGAQVYYAPGVTVGSYRQCYLQHVQTSRIPVQTVQPPVIGAGVGTTVACHTHIPMNAGESVVVNLAHNDATSPISFNVTSDNMWFQACLISTI